jgi:aryl-alcohol dehydrogenase-like predicted oxidoreductase
VCGIDTADNYRGGTSHRMLARVASDLLGQFTLSTKVGYLPTGDAGSRPAHSLDPAQLRTAVERSVDDLGRCPDMMFLHNPEHTLRNLRDTEARDQFGAAYQTLAEAVVAGLVRAWGIASWDPRPVVKALCPTVAENGPAAVLLRAGLSVAAPVLAAAEEMCRTLNVPPTGRWGMSSFGGNASDPVWQAVNLAAFLPHDQCASTAQAVFRLAYELPSVTRVAVGTTNAAHLQDLVAATDLPVTQAAIRDYRTLIDPRRTMPRASRLHDFDQDHPLRPSKECSWVRPALETCGTNPSRTSCEPSKPA